MEAEGGRLSGMVTPLYNVPRRILPGQRADSEIYANFETARASGCLVRPCSQR